MAVAIQLIVFEVGLMSLFLLLLLLLFFFFVYLICKIDYAEAPMAYGADHGASGQHNVPLVYGVPVGKLLF
jgi:hypothetical protein